MEIETIDIGIDSSVDKIMENFLVATEQVKHKLNELNKKIEDETLNEVKSETKFSFAELRQAAEILDILATIESKTNKNSVCETSDKIRKKLNQILDK